MEPVKKSNPSLNDQGEPAQFRVFLVSPSDVPLECKLAREVITHISSKRRFRGRVGIEVVSWDQLTAATEPSLTPPEAIARGLPKPEDCDLLVVILWSRFDTELAATFGLKEDGTPCLSGIEWEYHHALESFTRDGKPAMWLYRRMGAPQFAANDPELAEKLGQWRKLEAFFAPFTSPDHPLAGGVNYYEAPDDFRQQFERHLRDQLDRFLETLSESEAIRPDRWATARPNWTGSPYPGLRAFTAAEGPIFFGRGAEVDHLLQQFESPQGQFVAVVGAAGSGKSSLVKAGLLPRLRTGIIGNAPWIDLSLRPGERGDNPFTALAFTLKSALDLAEQTEKDITQAMQADPGVARIRLLELLARHKPASDLVLLIDQFEELFTQSNAHDREDFLKLLEGIVAQPQLRVIVTLRADFYARAIEEPLLAALLRRNRSTFPLAPPRLSALHQMIVRPAEAAGVELHVGLAQRLLDEAGEGPSAMPLIAFTLSQLYERQTASRYISLKAYEASGGVQGAIENCAEGALQGLQVDREKVLPKLFAELVRVNEQELATPLRPPQARLTPDVMNVAKALTEANLLVAGEGGNNQPVLEIVHQTVFDNWGRLREWIRERAERLRARRDLERVATEWDRSGRHVDGLCTGQPLRHYLSAAEPRSRTANDYLAACRSHRLRIRIGSALLGLLALVTIGILFQISGSQYPPTLAVKALLVQMGIWPVPEPEMVTIPEGEFEMGDLVGDGYSDEHPVHTVHFSKAFKMGKYEVTFDEYDLFAAATGRERPGDQGWGRGDRPVINVSWDEAVAYSQWLSKRLGMKYRLPTEAEWEYAARATTRTAHYWPDSKESEEDAACAHANVFDAKNEAQIKEAYYVTWARFNCEDAFPFTAPVGQLHANAWNLHDMLGNIWEWTQDCYADGYVGAPTDGSADETSGKDDCSRRVLRGGSWNIGPQNVRSSIRDWCTPDCRVNDVGFRLVRE